MNRDLSPLQEGTEDIRKAAGNVLTTGTGALRDTTGLVKNTTGKSFKIANQTIDTTGALSESGLKAASGLGVAALGTTTDVGVSALDTTRDIGNAGAKTASQISVSALETVGDGAKGTFSGISRLGNIIGKTGKATLERKQIRDEGARERSADNTKYRQEKKTAENKQLIEYKRKTDTELRNARNIIMRNCYDQIREKNPNYPFNKVEKHCERMANCKTLGRKTTEFRMKDLFKNANNECSKLKKKMGNKVNDEDWLNNKWDYEWNYTPERQIEEPMPIAAAAAGGKYTRKNIHKKHKKHKKTHKARTSKHNKSKKTGRKPMRKTRNHKNKHHQNKPKKH